VLGELQDIAGYRLRIVGYDRPFIFSAKINVGVIRADGEQLPLLNDDMEIATPDWIERLVMYADRPEIGAVGCRLRYEDGRLQHAGVLFDDGRPRHIYRGFSGGFKGYFNNVLLAQNYLAVTGACLMTPKDLFDEVGGLSATLPINFNDIDYCLKVWAAGRRVVYDPDRDLYAVVDLDLLYYYDPASTVTGRRTPPQDRSERPARRPAPPSGRDRQSR
jgi:hypothetical protein